MTRQGRRRIARHRGDAPPARVLIVLSSCARIPGTERRTGTWLEELAAPYYVFRDAGVEVRLASPAGGPAPIDPTSERAQFQTQATRRFRADAGARQALAHTAKLSAARPEEYDALFYSGGLGPVFDLTDDPQSVALIEAMHRAGKPLAAVCHGPAALRRARGPDGAALVRGRAVTAFSNSEELAANGAGAVPYLLEDELRRLGAHFTRAADGMPHVAEDGMLITGQNPASAALAAQRVLDLLG